MAIRCQTGGSIQSRRHSRSRGWCRSLYDQQQMYGSQSNPSLAEQLPDNNLAGRTLREGRLALRYVNWP